MIITENEFRKITEEALDSLSEKYLSRINNLALFVEDFPSEEQLRKTNKPIDNKYALLGLYEGHIQSSRRNMGTVLPDKITLFRVPIMQSCDTVEECRKRIKNILRHEIAHHFGSDETGARKAAKIS